jgi:hypothetical protein
MTTVHYYPDEDDFDNSYEVGFETDFDLNDEIDLQIMAEKVAKDYHEHHNGWENYWPLQFFIWVDGHKHHFEVERISVPEFTASRIK